MTSEPDNVSSVVGIRCFYYYVVNNHGVGTSGGCHVNPVTAFRPGRFGHPTPDAGTLPRSGGFEEAAQHAHIRGLSPARP